MRQTDEDAMIQRCGHGKPVQTQNGEWYMVYLCGRKLIGENGEQCSMLGRETALDPITWTADGWPIVNQLKGPSCLQAKPDLPEEMFGKNETETAFKEETLYQNWTFVRAPESDGYYVEDGRLYLKASRIDLDSMYARNILLRRQTAFNFMAECKMQIPDLKEGQDAGITCYYDENTYLKFGVFYESGGYVVKVSEKIGDQVTEHQNIPVLKGLITLRIVTEGFNRYFSFSMDGNSFETVAKLDNVYYLCDEGLKKGKRFTGAMIGMYGHAGENANEPLYVVYEDFVYKNL
jgi:xylan 1,4-beta-xylosidase